jgi:hypothetical protein
LTCRKRDRDGGSPAEYAGQGLRFAASIPRMAGSPPKVLFVLLVGAIGPDA